MISLNEEVTNVFCKFGYKLELFSQLGQAYFVC